MEGTILARVGQWKHPSLTVLAKRSAHHEQFYWRNAAILHSSTLSKYQ